MSELKDLRNHLRSVSMALVMAIPQVIVAIQEPSGTGGGHADEVDFYQPADVRELVDTSDAIVVVRFVRRLEPRKQTTTLPGGEVTDLFAQYVVDIQQVIKTHPDIKASGPLVVEQMVGGQTLEDFRHDRPDLAGGELLLFLSRYPHAGTFQFASWQWQFRRTPSGAPAPVAAGPFVEFVKEHPLFNTSTGARSPGDWDSFLVEIRTLVDPKRQGD